MGSSTACRPGTCSAGHRCQRPRSTQASVSTKSWRSGSATVPESHRWCWAARDRFPGSRTGIPCSIARTFPGAQRSRRPGQRRVRPWPSTNFSAPSPTGATAESSMPCSKTPGRYGSGSLYRTGSGSRSTLAAFTRSRVASNVPARSARPEAGPRAWPPRIARDPPMAFPLRSRTIGNS